MEKQDKIFWHEAFYEAVDLELHEYLKYLKFEQEHLLSKEALRIDLLVIKKEKDIKIQKNIGQIFKGYNIIEFKSEADSFSQWDYNKILGYAFLYSSFNRVPLSDMTVTISLTMYPRAVVRYLEDELGFTVRYVGEGIYYIEGEIIPIQILESKRMTNENNIFIRNLRSDVNPEDVVATVDEYRKIKPLNEKAAYLNRFLKANTKTFKEAESMFTEDTREIIMEMVEEGGWLEERDKRKAKKMLLDGEPVEKVARWMDLPVEELMDLV